MRNGLQAAGILGSASSANAPIDQEVLSLEDDVADTVVSRIDGEAEDERRDFHVYLDEFQNFTTLSLANMLSELRKYRVNLVLAHEYLSQLDEDVRDAILGNAGTIISFRLGVTDAEILAKEFYPEFSVEDLINLPNYNILPEAYDRRACVETVQRGDG
jgi:type IV secretory system conjugative DNA transfer VirD4/TraG family protein